MKFQNVTIRLAENTDIPVLSKWDREPHVIAATVDSETAQVAFDDNHNWEDELNTQNEYSTFYIGEVDGKPIGAMQIIDPHHEETHYWGEIEENLKAIDIWIGEKDAIGKGYGSKMMKLGLEICFSDPSVMAVVIDPLYSNKKAHQFYQKLGFVPIERRLFHDKDDCLVHRLHKSDWEKLKEKEKIRARFQ